jgi:hypothetical protein
MEGRDNGSGDHAVRGYLYRLALYAFVALPTRKYLRCLAFSNLGSEVQYSDPRAGSWPLEYVEIRQ